jgi:hypothetical protein
MPTIDCPTCGRTLRLPDDLAMATAQCPSCATTFPVSQAASVAAAAQGLPRIKPLRPVEVPVPDQPPPSPGDQRRCPYCREDVPACAAFCRHCGEELAAEDERVPPWERPEALRRDVAAHRGVLILTLGVVGLIASGIHVLSVVGVPLSLTAWIMGQGDLKRMRHHELDSSGEGLTQAGRICGIIGTCLGVLWWLVGLFLAVMYLAK